MNETQLRRRIVKFYDWLSSDRQYYLDLWKATQDVDMQSYYGEKASTYTSIKLYLDKYFSGVISYEKSKENRKHGL